MSEMGLDERDIKNPSKFGFGYYSILVDESGKGFICHQLSLEKVHDASWIKINLELDSAREFLDNKENNLPRRGNWIVTRNKKGQHYRYTLDKKGLIPKNHIILLEGVVSQDVIPFCGVHWKGFDNPLRKY